MTLTDKSQYQHRLDEGVPILVGQGLYEWRRVEAEKGPLRHVISTGKGTQTNCILAMSDAGIIEPCPEAAFFGNTHWEPDPVYRYADRIEPLFKIPVYESSRGDLFEDELRIHYNSDGEPYLKQNVPVFIKNQDGTQGRAMRKCTFDYKIRPAQQEMERWAGIKPGSRQEVVFAVSIGFTTDEVHRCDPSSWGRAVNRYPLIELGMSRQDCIDWMVDNGYGEPPRSACGPCPNRRDVAWVWLRENDRDLWNRSIQFEKDLQEVWRQVGRLDGIPFLHRKMIPLEDAVPEADSDEGQWLLCTDNDFGGCGV